MIGRLPKGWASPRLSDICHINPRGKSGLKEDDIVSFVPMATVSEISGSIVLAESRPLREVQKGYTPFQEGDVLFAKITPCMENGKAAIAYNLVNQRGYGSTEFHVIRPSGLVLAEWIFAIIRTSEFRRAAAASFQGAVGQQRVTASFLESFRIPLPPLSEQQRIVEILHETEEIRRLRADAEAKTAELVPAMFHDHFIIGQEHDYLPLYKFAEVISGVAIGRKSKGMTIEVPYLRVANVQAGFVDLSEVKTTSATEEEVERFVLQNGDVLLTEGGDFDKLGRGCLWEGQVDPCIHQNHVFRVRPIPGKLNSHFFAHYLQSAKAKNYFLRCAKKTTNLASINLTQLKALLVPNISIEDQERFELQIQLASDCNTSDGDKVFNALTRSLSAHAFSGQLTADWREVNKDKLAIEAHERDAAIKESGATLSRVSRTMAEEIEELLQDRTDGIYSDLNREQRVLLRDIERMFGGVDYGRYFTAEQLAADVQGRLHRHSQRIESHLSLFAVRGLVIPVSRARSDNIGPAFAACYRLPTRVSSPDIDGDDINTTTSDDIRTLLMETQRRLVSGNN